MLRLRNHRAKELKHSGTFEADLFQMNTFICCSTLQFLHFDSKNDKIFPLYITKTDKADFRLYFENEEKNLGGATVTKSHKQMCKQ